MIKQKVSRYSLIAPCGMNCGICMGYLRDKNHCPGCRLINENNRITRVRCVIKNCEQLKKNNSKFCFDCEKFPCRRMVQLDKRYRTKYHMSMIENLNNINRLGIRKFVQNEKVRWACTECGGTINVHRGTCSDCGISKF